MSFLRVWQGTPNQKYWVWALSLLSLLLYVYTAYALERSQFTQYLITYTCLFISFILLYKSSISWQYLLITGIAFRVSFLLAIPNLSQDFYRFIWDGNLNLEAISPYQVTVLQAFEGLGNLPVLFLENAQDLLQGMGNLNASHFSNYPPVSQFVFALAASFQKFNIVGNLIGYRIVLLVADLGILFLGKKLLVFLDRDPRALFLYFLNPFIIIELTGNVHFEGLMIFFMLAALFVLYKNRWLWSAVLWGIAIAVKLIPLIGLPMFLKYFISQKHGTYKLFIFYIIILAVFTLSFIPYISPQFIAHFGESVGLWFSKFEFNASLYYMVRWIGFQTVGWNIIASAAKVLAVIVCVSTLILSLYKRRQLPSVIEGLMWALCIYLTAATTVHPWYLATPLLLSVFTNYRFVVVWSFTIFFSYHAYRFPTVNENPYWLLAEYGIVGLYLCYEFWWKRPLKTVDTH